jgi:hypothetical protein
MGKRVVRIAKIPVLVKGPISAESVEQLLKLGFLPIHTASKPAK